MVFRFAHLADIHLGGYRDPKLKKLTVDAFEIAIEKIIQSDIDYVLISGDLFNTPLPGIDFLNDCVKNLKKLKKQNIPVYVIAGSHDFSLSGKTILNVLESADLILKTNNAKVVEDGESQKILFDPMIDAKTNSLIIGVSGKKGSYDKDVYQFLDTSNLNLDEFFSIFMFHNGINEMLPSNMDFDSLSVSDLPKGFDYYAGGHIHYTEEKENPRIVFPGSTFPENFRELEKFKKGFFKIVEVSDDKKINTELIEIHTKKVVSFSFDLDGLNPFKSTSLMIDEIKKRKDELNDSIVLIRAKGVLDGRTTNIDFRKVLTLINDYGAYVTLRNTSKLRSENIEMVDICDQLPVKEMENEVISQNFSDEKIPVLSKYSDYKRQLNMMVDVLSNEKNDDEKKKDYLKRVINEVDFLFGNLV
ncbi:MAG: metallophosphoesterase family protein [Candidatus Woesearchaeota archaeon]